MQAFLVAGAEGGGGVSGPQAQLSWHATDFHMAQSCRGGETDPFNARICHAVLKLGAGVSQLHADLQQLM